MTVCSRVIDFYLEDYDGHDTRTDDDILTGIFRDMEVDGVEDYVGFLK